MSGIYRFESANTHSFIVSTEEDKAGQDVTTAGVFLPGQPQSIFIVTPAITGDVTEVTIRSMAGVQNLYVSLHGDAENTKLTWSDKEYKWMIRATGSEKGTSYITPANGVDLYWFDEVDIGAGVITKAGKNIQPPQGEWNVFPVK